MNMSDAPRAQTFECEQTLSNTTAHITCKTAGVRVLHPQDEVQGLHTLWSKRELQDVLPHSFYIYLFKRTDDGWLWEHIVSRHWQVK